MWGEGTRVALRCMTETPFTGHAGECVTMPPRNVVPKPFQKPHPPVWVACTRRETIHLAAQCGIGALSFAFFDPEEARHWVDDYYATLANEAVPIGDAVNANLACVTTFMCHPSESEAIARGAEGTNFFGYSLAHYYVFGRHRPGVTDVWAEYQRDRAQAGYDPAALGATDSLTAKADGNSGLRGAVGTPQQVAALCERYEAAGVDQVIFVSQAGRNRHEDICESLELFGTKVLPRFEDGAERVEAQKSERLARACEEALKRRSLPRRADPTYVVSPQDEPRPAPTVVTEDDESHPARPRLRDALRRRGEDAAMALLRRRTDDQLERLVGSGPALRAIFRGMERSYRPEAAQGFTGEIQYDLAGKDGSRHWNVRVEKDRALAAPGRAATPAVTLRMSVPTFARILTRELEAGRAFLDGKLEVEGDLHLASRLAQMFARPQGPETTG